MGADAQGHRSAPRVAVADDLELVRELFREYRASLGSAGDHIVGFDEEVERLPGGYDVVLVAGDDGCVALRRLDDRACEMKRLYVRPQFRGKGLGRELAERVIAEARQMRYRQLRLDTVEPMMRAAVAMYRTLGFREIAPYRPNPIEGALYMELQL